MAFIPRKHHRYEIFDQSDVTLTIRRDDGDSDKMVAQVLDISRGGAKVAYPSTLQYPDALTLSLNGPKPHSTLTVAAEACWVRNDDGNFWLVGMRFVPEVPEAIFEEFIAKPIVERRQSARKLVCMTATAKWHDNRPNSVQVNVEDISMGGVCLDSPVPGRIGATIQLTLDPEGDDPLTLDASLRWQFVSPSGRSVWGCQFLFADSDAEQSASRHMRQRLGLSSESQ